MDKVLIDFLTEELHTPFQYGEMDCAIFTAKYLYRRTNDSELLTLLERINGTYSDEMGGIKILIKWLKERNITVTNPFEDVLIHFYGDPIAPLQALSGDIALGDWGDGESFGIVESHRVVAVADHGLVRMPLNLARRCWHV